MPTVHADCQASVDGRDLSRSVTGGLLGEDAGFRFAPTFADFLTDTSSVSQGTLETSFKTPVTFPFPLHTPFYTVSSYFSDLHELSKLNQGVLYFILAAVEN